MKQQAEVGLNDPSGIPFSAMTLIARGSESVGAKGIGKPFGKIFTQTCPCVSDGRHLKLLSPS